MTSMKPEKFVAIQRNEWNQAAPAWEKWDGWLDRNMADCNTRLLDSARVAEGHHVLDLGSGTGQPAVQAARLVGDSGQVTGLDVAENMLEVARRKAAAAGVSNVTFQACDVCRIPFEDERFDAVTSRFCLMFLPDLPGALEESHRVLKPGGSMAAIVWAMSDKNPAFTIPVGVLKEFTDIPQPDPSAPGLFSLGRPGALKSAMEASGFTDTAEEEVRLEWRYASGDEFVEVFRDLAAPLRPIFDRLTPGEQERACEKIAEKANQFKADDGVLFPGVAWLVAGAKPASA